MRVVEVEMLLAGGEMLLPGQESMSVLCTAGCGLSAGASRLLGGKGLGGGPRETEELSIFLDPYLSVQKMHRHVVLIFPASLTCGDNVRKYYCNHQIEEAIKSGGKLWDAGKKKSISTCWQRRSGHRAGPTNVREFVLGGGRPMLLRLLSVNRLSCSSSVQTAPALTLQKSDNLVLMRHGIAGRGLTFLWLRFKEFESWSTNAHPLPEMPCLNLQLWELRIQHSKQQLIH